MTSAVSDISPLYLLRRELMPLLAWLYAILYSTYEKEENTALVHEKAACFFDSFGNAILRLAYSYLHNMTDSEEILQETLMKYMIEAPHLVNDKHAKIWLMRVAANLSKNRIDYNRYRQTDELSDQLIAEEREDLSFVWEAVKNLKPTQREVIHLFYHEGYSTAEIAELLGRNESTVRSDLRRGREALKTVLKEEYDF